jgi:hypothetical protein
MRKKFTSVFRRGGGDVQLAISLLESGMPTAATRKLALFALCAVFAAVAPVAAAESYPSKPIRIIVTATPGGPPDLLTRWLAERLAPALGGVLVVENRPGAGGNVAMQAAARSAPDGHTLVVAGQGPSRSTRTCTPTRATTRLPTSHRSPRSSAAHCSSR